MLAIRDNVAPPTINLDNPSVETPIDLAPQRPRERKIDVALSNSFGFGGTNACLVLVAAEPMMRHMAANALTLLVVGLVVLFGVVAWARREYRAGAAGAGDLPEGRSGANMRRVSEKLVEQGAVAHPAILRIGADYGDRPGAEGGELSRIPEGASMAEIVEIVTRGGQSTCGTEIVHRIGVNAETVQVRELDVATGRFARGGGVRSGRGAGAGRVPARRGRSRTPATGSRWRRA